MTEAVKPVLIIRPAVLFHKTKNRSRKSNMVGERFDSLERFEQNRSGFRKTYLKCSLVISPCAPKYLFRKTRRVVTILKRAPKPKTTRYPAANESGGAPPKKDVCPAYSGQRGGAGMSVPGIVTTSLMVGFYVLSMVEKKKIVGSQEE